jgi:hypothetical protein
LLLQQGTIFQHRPIALASKVAAVICVGPTNGLGFELSADFITNRELLTLGTSVACNCSNWRACVARVCVKKNTD